MIDAKKIAEEIWKGIFSGSYSSVEYVASIIDKHLGEKKCEHDNGDMWELKGGIPSINTKKNYPTCPFCTKKVIPMNIELGGVLPFEPKKEEPMSKECCSIIHETYFKGPGNYFCYSCGTPRPAQQEKKLAVVMKDAGNSWEGIHYKDRVQTKVEALAEAAKVHIIAKIPSVEEMMKTWRPYSDFTVAMDKVRELVIKAVQNA